MAQEKWSPLRFGLSLVRMSSTLRSLSAPLAVGALAFVAVLRKPETLLQGDAYLALVAGRFVAQHGLPTVDTLATVTRGQAWIDEQWLGQLLIYASERLGGPTLLVLSEALVTAAAFAVAARYALKRESGLLAILVSALAGIFFCAIFFGVRPQMFSLLLFAIILSRIGDEDPPLWTIAVLVLWANLHGAVLVGAALVALRGAYTLLAGDRQRALRSGALIALAAVSPFASPYILQLPAYFVSIGHLQDSSRHLPIIEWTPMQWQSGWVFFLVAGVTLLLALASWSKHPRRFELAVLLLTALAAWRANRNVQWFGLALAAYGPTLIAPYLRWRPALALHLASGGAFAAVLFFTARAFTVSFAANDAVLPLLHDALLADPQTSAVVSEDLADWALWREPLLQGRIAFDVRFELLDDQQARDLATFLYGRPGWQTLYPEARLVLVSRNHRALSEQLLHLSSARLLWQNEAVRLVER